MTTWEYKIVSWGTTVGEWQEGERQLNDLGQEGWEAVSMSRSPSGHINILLKRPTSCHPGA